MTNDILVKPGSKLTIRSGTELNFLNGIGMLVLGELAVDGYFSSPIRFSLASQNNLNFEPSPVDEPLTETLRADFGLKLVDGRTDYEGRLQVELNGEWGTVCNRGWNLLNSKIVCQQMGLIVDPNYYLFGTLFKEDPRESEPILMSEVDCDPLNTLIFECQFTPRKDHTCTHEDDVWLKCLPPTWAGVRVALTAQKSRIKYATFERAGQYDYAKSQLAPALQIDMNQHEISNLTFTNNYHNSFEILFSQPFKNTPLRSLTFIKNKAPGLLTRTSFVTVDSLIADSIEFHSGFEYNPYLSTDLLKSVRLYSSQPRRGYQIRRELTRLNYNLWHIGSEEVALLYTDPESNYGPIEINVQIQTDNNRVLVVDLIDYNTDFEQEKVLFCEKFCQNSLADPNAREWNLSMSSNSIYFPINTSYSVLHVNYNVTKVKSGRLMFLVYSVKAPEPIFDYTSIIFKN